LVHNTQGYILIDTPGVNPFSDEDQKFLKEWISDYASIWVNPVNTDMNEAKEYAQFFYDLGANRQFITKTDLCRKLGSTLSFLIREETSLAYWCNNPKISVSLQEGTPQNLAELMIEKYMTLNKINGNTVHEKE
jgi:flagellar biosynthesis GTPase FlhF